MRAARKRVAFALAASLLIHAVFAGLMRGGSSTLTHRASVQQYIHARLIEPGPPALPDAPPVAPEMKHAGASERRKSTRDSASAATESTAAHRASTAITAASAVDAKYYSARELDVYPAPLAPLLGNLQPAAARTNGYALLAIMLDATGTVTQVRLLEAEPADLFGDDGVKSIASTRFTPALKNGRAVKARIIVRIDYGAGLGR